jgi:hypothetical protein
MSKIIQIRGTKGHIEREREREREREMDWV